MVQQHDRLLDLVARYDALTDEEYEEALTSVRAGIARMIPDDAPADVPLILNRGSLARTLVQHERRPLDQELCVHVHFGDGETGCGIRLYEDNLYQPVADEAEAVDLAPLCRRPECFGDLGVPLLALQQKMAR